MVMVMVALTVMVDALMMPVVDKLRLCLHCCTLQIQHTAGDNGEETCLFTSVVRVGPNESRMVRQGNEIQKLNHCKKAQMLSN